MTPRQYPDGCTLLPLLDIKHDDRQRQDYGNLQELADSISEFGLFHPLLLTRDNILIDGGRRLSAMQLLDWPDFPCMYRESMPEHLRLEMELEANIRRLGMKWQEQCLNIYNIHKAKTSAKVLIGEKWRRDDTGALLGVSQGHVNHCIYIAECLLAQDEEIIAAQTMTIALQTLVKRKEEQASRELAERTGVIKRKPAVLQSGVIRPIDVGASPLSSSVAEPNAPDLPSVNDSVTVDLREMFYLGDFRTVLPKLKGQVDHIVTDIPYGIEMKNLDMYAELDMVIDEHDVDENVSLFEPFLQLAYDVLPDTGFCVFWYDLDHHETLKNLATKAGFKVQRWPLIWSKEHPCRNSAPQFNLTKSHETAMFCRKGNATLVEPVNKSVFSADGSVERRLYSNPFAKPFEAWKRCIAPVAIKGQIVCDPFAGQFSCLRAAVNLGMVPRAIELCDTHYMRGVEMMKDLFRTIAGSPVDFVE